MSKDVMIGKTEEEIDGKETALDLGDDFLGDVYVSLKPLRDQYPFLWKLVKDFYEHVFFSADEAKCLGREIEQFLAASPKINNDSVVWLDILKNLCREAIGKKMTLFCIAD